jgi:enoyl-CoA hydratase/carnithine racemase
MTDEVVLVDRSGPVWTVTLNRPDALNSFDAALHRAFNDVWREVEQDMDVRAVVLTGAGKAFCAGGNIEDFPILHKDFAIRRRTLRDARRVVAEMLDVHVPVVAAVHGPAVGLGCTLSTLCDVVVISEDTYLQDPHVAVALVAGDGGAVTWPHYTSLLTAKRYLLTGDRIPAQEAVRLGLATFAVPKDRVLDEAKAFAERLAALPHQSVQDTKALLNQHLRVSAAATLGYGLAAESQSHDTAEYQAVPEQFARRKG